MVKNPPASAGDGRDRGWIPGLGRSPGEGQPLTSVFLPGESHGQRSLASYELLWSIGSERVRHDSSDLAITHTE